MHKNKVSGLFYEEVAQQYLLKQGLTLVAQNYSSRFGEIDLIMLDQDSICFIEVKFRKDNRYGGAISAISTSKQQKIIKTATFFISKNPQLAHNGIRFDALLLQPGDATQETDINWIPNAFYAE